MVDSGRLESRSNYKEDGENRTALVAKVVQAETWLSV